MRHYSKTEKKDAEKVDRALMLIKNKDIFKARRLLNEVALNTPREYVYSFEENGSLYIKFWDFDEFVHFISNLPEEGGKNVVWLLSAYPRAHFYLGFLDVNEGKYESALLHLENCLKLEPDQPLCYCEMAIAYSRMGQHNWAFSLYERALKLRPYITAAVKARALRGMGVELVELGQLDFAEQCLKESLKYDPNNEVAFNELRYIYTRKAEGNHDPVNAPINLHTLSMTAHRRCDNCGKEIISGLDDGIGAIRFGDRVLYVCPDCSQRPDICAETALSTLKKDFRRLHHQGQFSDAYEVAVAQLNIAEQTFGEDHPEVATALSNMALALKDMGRYEEAEPLLVRAVDIESRAGSDPINLAIFLNNLAELYRVQGKYKEVEPLLKRSLEIKINILGPAHPGVANSINGLAVFYMSQNRLEEAEPLFIQAMNIYLQAFGPGDPNLAKTAGNLGELYLMRGSYDQAESLLKMSLELKERAFGPVHPIVAVTLNSLATLYQRQNKFDEAEAFYRRALDVFKNTVRPDHPNIAVSLSGLAMLADLQGRYQEAEVLYKKALAIFENALGPDHPETVSLLKRIVNFFLNNQRFAEADEFSKRLRFIDQKNKN